MLEPNNNNELPPIPGKRYFTIGEVSALCDEAYVLRYWEQELLSLPMKRRGNRRYYQRQDVIIVRQIRGFSTITDSLLAVRGNVWLAMTLKKTVPSQVFW